MQTIEREQKREALRAEFLKADDAVIQTLSSDAASFGSGADMRETLNQARALRDWALRNLAALDQPH